MRRIAIVEDDLDQRERLQAMLKVFGNCFTFEDSQSFLKAMRSGSFDLACIDWNLPDLSGVELISRIRAGALAPDMPIILVTARSTDEDTVAGLTGGADDYVTKPIKEPILLARVETLLRRLAPPADDQIEAHGEFTFDRGRDVVIEGGREILLTPKEFSLALLMFRNLRRPMARSYLMEAVWGTAQNVSSRTLDTHVCRLKTKLGLVPANGYSFVPLYGFGYRLDKVSALEPVAQ